MFLFVLFLVLYVFVCFVSCFVCFCLFCFLFCMFMFVLFLFWILVFMCLFVCFVPCFVSCFVCFCLFVCFVSNLVFLCFCLFSFFVLWKNLSVESPCICVNRAMTSYCDFSKGVTGSISSCNSLKVVNADDSLLCCFICNNSTFSKPWMQTPQMKIIFRVSSFFWKPKSQGHYTLETCQQGAASLWQQMSC